jgi:hypothetical protein
MTDTEIKKHIMAFHRKWEADIDLRMNRYLQVLLEDVEKQFPGWAAEMDNRAPNELTGIAGFESET